MSAEISPAPQSPMPAIPWTTRDVWLGLGIFALWLAGFIAFQAVVAHYALSVNVGLTVTVGELLLLLPVWRLSVRKYGLSWQSLGLRSFKGSMLALGCGLMLTAFTFNALYALFLALFDLRIQVDLIPVFQEMESPWLFFIGGAIVAPVVEEIFFRGFVFAGLTPKYGWQKAAVISALLFALLHLTPTAILPIFFLGLIFAYLYYQSGSIWPAILMHMLTNSLALGAQMYLAFYGDSLLG